MRVGMLALGLCRGRVMLLDVTTEQVQWVVQAHSPAAAPAGANPTNSHSRSTVAMSPTGRFVASIGAGNEHWKLWDATSGALHRVGATHDGTGACICNKNVLGRRVLQEGCPVVAHTGGVHAISFSSGHRLASRGYDGAVIVWDAETGEAEYSASGPKEILEEPRRWHFLRMGCVWRV